MVIVLLGRLVGWTNHHFIFIQLCALQGFILLFCTMHFLKHFVISVLHVTRIWFQLESLLSHIWMDFYEENPLNLCPQIKAKQVDDTSKLFFHKHHMLLNTSLVSRLFCLFPFLYVYCRVHKKKMNDEVHPRWTRVLTDEGLSLKKSLKKYPPHGPEFMHTVLEQILWATVSSGQGWCLVVCV